MRRRRRHLGRGTAGPGERRGPGPLARALVVVSLSSVGLTGAIPAEAARTGAVAPAVPGLKIGRLTPWVGCGEGLQCALLPVPLDHTKPAAGTIDLAVIRRPAADPKRRVGSLIYLEGGPGVSGVNSIETYPQLFDKAVRDRFDIVGFDQRGVGLSAPVRCLTDAQKASELAAHATPPGALPRRAQPTGTGASPGPASAVLTQLAATAEADRKVALGCEKLSRSMLQYVSTEDAARDLDLLRAALGEQKMTAYGSSYGTEVGATYAALFPRRLRALVLDAVVDPRTSLGDPFKETRIQARGFEAALNAFFAACKADASCPFGHGDPAGAYDRLMARLATHPIYAKGKDVDRTRPVDAQLAQSAVVQLLYSQAQQWPILALALHQAADDNDGSVILALTNEGAGQQSDGTYDNSFDANTIINCSEQAYPKNVAAFRNLAKELARETPRIGASLALQGLTCAFWTHQAKHRYTGPFRAQGAPPILLVGTTGDPATPYSEAQSLARQFDSGVLLTWKSYSHGAYEGSSTCIHKAVDDYLVTAKPPKPGTVCP